MAALPIRLFHPLRAAVLGAMFAVMTSSAGAQTVDQLFDDTQTQDMHLQLSQRDWDTMHRIDDDTFYAADLTWNGVTVRNVGIRHRGGGTRNLSKPGLLVDMNHYVAGQKFLGMTGLVLDNAYSDPSMVREAVAVKVYRQLGIRASREAHARLFVNGVFAGVYVMVERLDRHLIENDFGAAEGDEESGGHLLEYKWIDEYLFQDLGDALRPYAERFNPHTRETDSAVNQWGPVQALVHDLNTVTTDRLMDTLGKRLDLVQVARFAAVQTCLAEADGLAGYDGVNNFYIYFFRDGRPARLLAWDMDHSFTAGQIPVGYRMDTTVLTSRIMEHPQLRDTYYQALLECAQFTGQPSATDDRGWLEREFARLFANIGPSVVFDRWALFDYDEFVQEQTYLLDIARSRPGYLICQLTSGSPDTCTAPDH